MEQTTEEKTINYFAISEDQLKFVIEAVSNLPYKQAQPVYEMIGKLPSIKIQDGTTA